jgi:hypothetical protein
MASFAMAYAERTQDDYKQLVKAKHGINRDRLKKNKR